LNGGTYEYFFSTSPTATSADAEYLGQGLTFTHNGLGFWTNYYYFIRSSNAYGKSSFLYVPAQTSNDVSAYLAALAGKIGRTELGQDLFDEIDKIPGLQAQIDALDGLKGYEPDQVYLKWQMIVDDGQIYLALQPVPVNTPPPNPLYWEDVGDLLEAANGLAEQVATHTSEITELDGVVTAQAAAFEALRASYRDDDGAGDLADAIKSYTSTAAIASESKVRASENEAMARRVTTFDAKIGENAANITELEEVVATNESATATKIDQLNVSVGQNSAAIQQTSTAYADTAGKLSTMWSVKMQVNAQGQYVAAGIGLGIENTAAGLQSQFLVSADRFAIVNTIAGGAISVPFAVQGGQVFMNSAFIQDGSITMLKIGQYLQSDNYIPGTLGWRLDKAGNLEFNGPAPGGGRLTMTNRAIKVFDQNGVKRVQLGDLDA
uniref:phage tail protein n=1 Tax=Pseudomonas parakoreensis TaxID=2892331 RepID=UPI001F2CEB9D